jgi:hypothetical protein
MAETEALDARGYCDAIAVAARVLADHAGYLDELDQPDAAHDGPGSDGGGARVLVGTDLACTLEAAAAEASGARDFAAVSRALTAGARAAARGRGGRGTARLLAGIEEVLCNADRLDAGRLALALEAAAERFAPADDGRHPGGMAAVVAASADAALAAHDVGAGLAETLISAVDAGLEELERGPVADPVLARRGVVDAAAAGYLLVLDTLASLVTGEPLPSPPEPARAEAGRGDPAATGVRYVVACRIIPDEEGIESAVHLEDLLVGVSEVVEWSVAGASWRVAVHTPDPGAVVEALVDVGRPRELRIALLDEPPRNGPDRPTGTTTGAPVVGPPAAGGPAPGPPGAGGRSGVAAAGTTA